jgi:HAD superfamily hydrolase (TIGR01509 family)
MLTALLFDVDGTLAETERDGHRNAYNAAFAEFGLDWHWDADFYGTLLPVAGGKERLRHFLQHSRVPEADRPDIDDLIGQIYATKTQLFQRWLASDAAALRPGVARLIREAHEQGVALGVVTTTSPGNVTELLEHQLGAGSTEWFSVIVAGDMVPAKKPAPDAYVQALEKLGVDAAECIAMEDSGIGLRSALAAGISTVITVNDYTADDDFTGALAVLSDLGEPDAPYRRLDQPGAGVVDLTTLRSWLPDDS